MPIRRSKRSSVEQRSQRKAKIVAVFVTSITIFAQTDRQECRRVGELSAAVILNEVKDPTLGRFKLNRVNYDRG